MRLGSEQAAHTSTDGGSNVAPLSLRSNFGWTLAGNVVYAVCQWALLVLLARLAAPRMVGRLALGFAVTTPMFMLAGLQLRAVQSTDARREFGFGDYLTLRLLTTCAAMLAVFGVAAGPWFGRETALVMVLVGCAKAVESISDVFYGLLQQHERMDRIAVSMVLRSVPSLAAFGIVLAASGSLAWGLVCVPVVWAAVLIAYDTRSGRLVTPSLKPRWDRNAARKLLVLSLPLGLVMMLVSLNTNIPRYAVEHYMGEFDLGLFAAVAALLVAGNTVVAALGQSASPRMAIHYAECNRPAFVALVTKLLGMGGLLGLAGVGVSVIAGSWILRALYGSAYAGEGVLLSWMAVAAAVSYLQSFTGYAVTSARYFAVQAPLLAAVTGATALFCLWLVPQRGLIGAALALAAAAVVHLGGNILVLVHALSRMRGPVMEPALERQ